MANIKVPDELQKVLQKIMYSVDDDGNFIFPVFNDGICLFLALIHFRSEFDEAKRHPNDLKTFQKKILKQIQKLQRDKILPINAKKIRWTIADES